MDVIKPLIRSSNFQYTAVAAVCLATLAIVNAICARRAEKMHPSYGKFIAVDGVKLHYTDRGQGVPVVLIHGNAVSGDDWNISGLAEALELTHRVIIFDRPGCGHSERPRGKAWTAAQQAALIHNALRKLEVKRPIIVGHSFGAIVAAAYAARYHAETAALILVSGYYFWTFRPDVLMATVGALPVLGDICRYTISPLFGWLNMPFFKRIIFYPAKVTMQFEKLYSPAMALRPSQIRATSVDGTLMMASVIELQRTYEHFMMPVTILAGSGDKIVFKKNAERLHKVIAGSALHIIEHTGHMLHHSHPEQVISAVTETTAVLTAHGDISL